MDKILDIVFWFFNNPEKANKIWLISTILVSAILIGVAAFFVLEIPGVVNNFVTGG